MSVERPTNWGPPEKTHGGEEITEFYAMMLVDQIVSMMCMKFGSFDLPIAAEMDNLTKLLQSVEERLKQTGQYFYQPEGSIFMDYKILRGEAYKKIGNDIGIDDPKQANIVGYQALREQFSQDMTTDEALELAKNIVAQWDW